LDGFGRDRIKDATFVELSLSDAGEPKRRWTENAWLEEKDADSITVLGNDLLPWIYRRNSVTTIPSSWNPRSVKLESVRDADLESVCKELAQRKEETADDSERIARKFHAPGPSYRLLMAHGAWKKGLTQYCVSIVSADPQYTSDFPKYRSAVREDLAWLHFLRGVNLLMYANRKEVLPHLRLVLELSPECDYVAQAKDLAGRLEKLVAQQNGNAGTAVDESKLTDAKRAELYVSQLKDICCPQMAQPGDIFPYLAVRDGKPEEHPPTLRLKEMGMQAVPALITALEDDTPTRTVYHWRDFAHSRLVWRVSDFAWNILRDITRKEFGYRSIGGFTLSGMKPDERRRVIEEIKAWYAATKNLSPDDRMFASFSSRNPKDWLAAGQYFLAKKDKRAITPLLEKIPQARSFDKGDLCELVAKFGDPSVRAAIKEVLENAEEHSDRLAAAIALWTLGDDAGIPVAIKYVKAHEQPYGAWDTPIWFLMGTRRKEALAALKVVVTEAPASRAGEVIGFVLASITGDLWGKRREPAGCVEICPVLIAAMDRSDYTGGSINNIKIRIKDDAAKALALLKVGKKGPFGGRFLAIDAAVFNELEPDEAKRDAQIKTLKEWYEKHKDRLGWDSKSGHLVLKPESGSGPEPDGK
jgi:HEAT repeat protein